MRTNVLYISKNRMNWELWYSQYKPDITYTGSNTDKNNSCEKTTASIFLVFGKLLCDVWQIVLDASSFCDAYALVWQAQNEDNLEHV